MAAADPPPTAAWEFEAEIIVLHHPTTISCRYQAMVHCGAVRQTAAIVHMDLDQIRTGDKTRARLRFVRHPECVLLCGVRVRGRPRLTRRVVGPVVAAVFACADTSYPTRGSCSARAAPRPWAPSQPFTPWSPWRRGRLPAWAQAREAPAPSGAPPPARRTTSRPKPCYL